MIYKPICAWSDFCGCDNPTFARKRLMRSKRFVRTTYGFARKRLIAYD